MGSITVKLPDEQKEKIEEQVEENNYPNLSEWVRETIRMRITKEKRNTGLFPDERERVRKVKEKEDQETYTMEEVLEKLDIDESEVQG